MASTGAALVRGNERHEPLRAPGHVHDHVRVEELVRDEGRRPKPLLVHEEDVETEERLPEGASGFLDARGRDGSAEDALAVPVLEPPEDPVVSGEETEPATGKAHELHVSSLGVHPRQGVHRELLRERPDHLLQALAVEEVRLGPDPEDETSRFVGTEGFGDVLRERDRPADDEEADPLRDLGRSPAGADLEVLAELVALVPELADVQARVGNRHEEPRPLRDRVDDPAVHELEVQPVELPPDLREMLVSEALEVRALREHEGAREKRVEADDEPPVRALGLRHQLQSGRRGRYRRLRQGEAEGEEDRSGYEEGGGAHRAECSARPGGSGRHEPMEPAKPFGPNLAPRPSPCARPPRASSRRSPPPDSRPPRPRSSSCASSSSAPRGTRRRSARGSAAWLLGIALGAAARRRGVPGPVLSPFALLSLLAGAGGAGVVVLRLLRVAAAPPAGELPGLGLVLLLASVSLLPSGALVGASFAALGAHAATLLPPGEALTRLYVVESIGSLVAGACASLLVGTLLPPLTAALLAGLVAALLLLASGLPGRRPALAAAALLALASAASRPLDQATERLRFAALSPAAPLVSVRDTPHAHLALGGEPLQLWESGAFSATFPDPYASETLAHLAASLAESPRRVLALGAVERGLLRFLLRHSPERVDLVVSDPLAFSFVRDRLPREDLRALLDPRVHVVADDPRRFLSRTRGDVGPDPPARPRPRHARPRATPDRGELPRRLGAPRAPAARSSSRSGPPRRR